MIRHRLICFAIAALFSGFFGCAADLPKQSPPLAAMQEPPALLVEPSDELERAALDPGAFSGIEVADARASLDALLEEPEGVAVARVVENSPAAQAGIVPGDLLLAVRLLPDGSQQELSWPSEWRDLELKSAAGSEIELSLDRAGATKRARLILTPRYKAAERIAVARLREDQRAGIVVRSATEVEARKAGMGPGAGAVIVGLSGDSPWRKADVRFEDLIVAVDGEPISAPDVLIDRIRAAKQGATLELDLRRAGVPLKVRAPLTKRDQDISEFSIPLVYSYEHTRTGSETSVLFGLFYYESTRAAWAVRLLWLIRFSGGDSDRLEELGS